MDNYKTSAIKALKQRYVYPVLHGFEGMATFCYDLYPKSKNAPTKANPDNPLKRYVYECEVDIDKAKEQIKLDIIKYFKLCKATGTQP